MSTLQTIIKLESCLLLLFSLSKSGCHTLCCITATSSAGSGMRQSPCWKVFSHFVISLGCVSKHSPLASKHCSVN